jgi:cytochrome P450
MTRSPDVAHDPVASSQAVHGGPSAGSQTRDDPGRPHVPAAGGRPGPQEASIRDTVAALLEVGLPMLAKGPLIRRPPAVAMSERLGLDTRAVRRVQRLHAKYAPGPLMLRIPLRRMALVLEPADVHRVLHGSPEPFAVSTAEKRGGLPHFEPDSSLVSHGRDRADRRRFSEVVLDTQLPVHRLGSRFLDVLDEEAALLMARARRRGRLDWHDFTDTWFPMVRRIVLGDAATDDDELRDMLDSLRRLANLAILAPRREELRRDFHARLQAYLDRAEPGSLASLVPSAPVTERTAPTHQVAQWLFAFDPAAMATFRALALLATHPVQRQDALREVAEHRGEGRTELRYLRACLLESLRLWPTTPLILRETTTETQWGTGTLPAGTAMVIFAPFFHRDDRHVPYAHRFHPEVFLDESVKGDWPLVPFSGGPAICPGQNLVLLLSSAMLATLLDGLDLRMEGADRLDPSKPLPGILDNYSVRFAVRRPGRTA